MNILHSFDRKGLIDSLNVRKVWTNFHTLGS